MLTLLRISGFALIDEVELPLSSGMTVITGETGAGKSILVEALGLLRGGRASADLIRTGRDEAQVEAMFELPAALQERLETDGRSAAEGLLVRRLVARNGRGRVHLGGGLATVSDLAAAIGPIVDITSQHDQQSLMDPDSQLSILDAFAGVTTVETLAAWQALTAAEAELATFDADARTRAEREDLLRFQLSELAEAKLEPGEDEALKAERERVKSAEKFMAACTRGEETLYSGDRAVAAQMAQVARELEPLAALDPKLGPLVERLREAQALADDVGRELGRYGGGVRFDPQKLSEIEERLFLIQRLVRKHGGALETAIQRRDQIAHELEALGSFEDGVATRRQAVLAARERMASLAAALSDRRRKAARTLGKKIEQTLHELGLAHARLPVAVEDREDLGPKGKDRVKFLFAANPGEEPRPLARIASGGELSRVMLAVKQALAGADQALVSVFDEVDTGVGGGTAEVIGRKLKAIAAERQVLAVTHLPQIAAFADHHVRVVKEATKGRTTVRIEVLDDAGRTAELARMLGGARPSREATAHADEMRRRARV